MERRKVYQPYNDESHMRWLSKRNLTRATHWLLDWHRATEPSNIVDRGKSAARAAEVSEVIAQLALPTVDSVTGAMVVDINGYTMEEKRLRSLKAQQEADRINYPMRPDFEPPEAA